MDDDVRSGSAATITLPGERNGRATRTDIRHTREDGALGGNGYQVFPSPSAGRYQLADDRALADR
jgi:hypothetical protein